MNNTEREESQEKISMETFPYTLPDETRIRWFPESERVAKQINGGQDVTEEEYNNE